MAERHLTPDLLWAVLQGKRPSAALIRRGLAHLCRLCRPCREELRAARQEDSAPRGLATYTASYQRALARVQAARGEVAAEGRAARENLAALLALPRGRRAVAVAEEPEKFRGLALAELLLAESRSLRRTDAAEAGELARLARRVLEQSPTTAGARDAYARATAYLSNACRIQGHLREAEDLFAVARFLLGGDAADPLAGAELDSLEASLRRAQRRLSEAVSLLAGAATVFGLLGERREQAASLLNMGLVFREQADWAQAIEVTRRALALLDPVADPFLVLNARHNLAWFLCDAGAPTEARQTLEECEELYGRFAGTTIQLRRRWLAGNVAAALGEEGGAEAAFREARAGFLAHGVGYDVALVSLDLAALFLRQGRTAEVKALAEEMVPLFEAQGIHREAGMALALFAEAARAERLTLAWLAQLGRYLEAARRNPALAFDPHPP
jgi:tetratricopeptide (TPR) repeat protein